MTIGPASAGKLCPGQVTARYRMNWVRLLSCGGLPQRIAGFGGFLILSWGIFVIKYGRPPERRLVFLCFYKDPSLKYVRPLESIVVSDVYWWICMAFGGGVI